MADKRLRAILEFMVTGDKRVTDSVKKLDKATGGASKSSKEYAKASDEAARSSKAFASQTQNTKTGLERVQGAFGKVAIGAAAAGAALYTAKKAFDFAQEGAQIQQVKESFDRMNESVFKTPDLLDEMSEAARGTISETQLMSGVLTLVAGTSDEMAKSLAEGAPKLLEIAKAANKLNPTLGDTAFMYQSLSLGIKRQSKLIIDNLGLNVSLGQANIDYAAALGKTVENLTDAEKSQAFYNATLDAGEALIEQVGGNVDSAADSYQQLTTEVTELTDALKVSVSEGLTPFIKHLVKGFDLRELSSQFNDTRSTLIDLGASWGDINDIVGDGRAKLDFYRTAADMERDLDASARGIMRLNAALDAVNRGLDIGTDEFYEYIAAQEELLNLEIESERRSKALNKQWRDRQPVVKKATEALRDWGAEVRAINTDIPEFVDETWRMVDSQGELDAAAYKATGNLILEKIAAGELTQEWILADPQLRNYIETQTELNQWLINNRDAIDNAKRALVDYGDVGFPEFEGPTVAGRASYEIYVEVSQAKQDIEDFQTELDDIEEFYKSTIELDAEQAKEDAFALNEDLDKIAGYFDATLESNAEEAKTPIDRLNEELDIFNTADGADTWFATMDSNAETVKTEQLDPVTTWLNGLVEGNPYPISLDTNTAEEDAALAVYARRLQGIPDKEVTITTNYVTNGTPPSSPVVPPPSSPNDPDYPGRAVGGPVSAGQTYLVGERGPELFMSNTPGRILPNNQVGSYSGGDTIISIDARGATNPAILDIQRAVELALDKKGRKADNIRRTA